MSMEELWIEILILGHLFSLNRIMIYKHWDVVYPYVFEKENCKIFLTVNKSLLFNKTVTK